MSVAGREGVCIQASVEGGKGALRESGMGVAPGVHPGPQEWPGSQGRSADPAGGAPPRTPTTGAAGSSPGTAKSEPRCPGWGLVGKSAGAATQLTVAGDVACQAPLSLGFSRQEYCSGLPCSPPADPPDQGSNLDLLYWEHGVLATGPPREAPQLKILEGSLVR